jgi:hypothetical protein
VNVDVLIIAAVAVVGIVTLARFFAGGRRPKQQSFRCARCSNSAMHTARTIEAWRNGKTKFFCNSCHGDWLKTQPRDSKPARGTRSGCLGAMVILVLIPVVAAASYSWW